METVTLDGVEYTKATTAAKQHGYTSDYVGQLCRAGKVDAQLVGRSWYVNIESLLTHRKGRYRSNQKKTKQAVAEARAELNTAAEPRFVTRLAQANISYEPDLEETIPVPRKVVVESDEEPGLQEAQRTQSMQRTEHTVPITESTADDLDYLVVTEKEEHPTHGSLPIEEAPEADDLSEIEPSKKPDADIEERPQIITAQLAPRPRPRPRRRSTHSVGQERRTVVSDIQHTPLPSNEPADRAVPSTRSSVGVSTTMALTLSLFAGLLVSALMVGVAWRYEGTPADHQAGYQLNVSAVISAIQQ